MPDTQPRESSSSNALSAPVESRSEGGFADGATVSATANSPQTNCGAGSVTSPAPDPTPVEAPALEPRLTKLDLRILGALDSIAGAGHVMLNPWQIAERLRHDDVAEIRSILRGLNDFGYVMSKGWDHRQVWLRLWKGDEAIEEAGT